MKGILHIIGAGPGDPELLTIKAFHVLTENTDVVAYPEIKNSFPSLFPCLKIQKLFLMPIQLL